MWATGHSSAWWRYKDVLCLRGETKCRAACSPCLCWREWCKFQPQATRRPHSPRPSLQSQAQLWRDVMENRFYGFSSILVIEVRNTEPSKGNNAEVMIRHLISSSAEAQIHFAENLWGKPKMWVWSRESWADSQYTLNASRLCFSSGISSCCLLCLWALHTG